MEKEKIIKLNRKILRAISDETINFREKRELLKDFIEFAILREIDFNSFLKSIDVSEIICDVLEKVPFTEEENEDIYYEILDEISRIFRYNDLTLENGVSYFISPSKKALRNFLESIEVPDDDNVWRETINFLDGKMHSMSLNSFWNEFCKNGGK